MESVFQHSSLDTPINCLFWIISIIFHWMNVSVTFVISFICPLLIRHLLDTLHDFISIYVTFISFRHLPCPAYTHVYIFQSLLLLRYKRFAVICSCHHSPFIAFRSCLILLHVLFWAMRSFVNCSVHKMLSNLYPMSSHFVFLNYRDDSMYVDTPILPKAF